METVKYLDTGSDQIEQYLFVSVGNVKIFKNLKSNGSYPPKLHKIICKSKRGSYKCIISTSGF